ncbi:MAG TPA: carboxypeptidase-like regulatory domain-containing protein [Bryobacteraceae bacterium]
MKTLTVGAVMAAATLLTGQDAPTGAVEGTVINPVTGAGIAGARVVFSSGPRSQFESTSDATGHFRIAGMAPGTYRPSAEKDGFASPPPLDLNPLNSLLVSGVRVAAGPDPLKLDLKLIPLNTVAGRVFGPDGKPLAGAEVSLNPNITADMAITDKEGRFRLDEIRPSSYKLIAKPPAGAVPVEARDGTRTAIVPTYYPSAADPSQAQPILLQGQTAPEYDIQMQSAVVHRVRGIVVREEGKPAPDVELTLFRMPEGVPGAMALGRRFGGPASFAIGLRPEPRGVVELTVTTRYDGHFEFPAVPGGDWRINAESDRMRGAASVSLGRDDVEDLRIQIAAPFNLTGTIEGDADGKPLLSPITLVNAEVNEFARGGFAESGRLLFENISPGNYKALPGPGWSAQIFLGQYEATGQTFSLSAGSPPIRVVLKAWSGSVRGTVEKGEGTTVVLIPQSYDGIAVGQTVACGPGGSFEMNSVSPGDYYIAAFDRMDGISPSAAMLSLMPSRGTSVRVEEGSAASVTLSVIPTPP